jgi:hypothetical protein
MLIHGDLDRCRQEDLEDLEDLEAFP